MITRFLEPTEFNLLRSIFDVDNRAFGKSLTPESIDELCNGIITGVAKNIKKCAITLSESGELLCIVLGTAYSKDAGWLLGIVKVQTRKQEFNDNYAVIAQTMDYMISYMESIGIYKFLDVKRKPLNRWIIGRKILNKHSKLLPRYETNTNTNIQMSIKDDNVVWISTLKPEFIPASN